MRVNRIVRCRLCKNTSLLTILDLGSIAISDFPRQQSAGKHAPLTVVLCNPHSGCGLLQLAHRGVDRQYLYEAYWYASGINQSMKRALKDIVSDCQRRIALKPGDVVVDIGANDGTLLSFYPQSLTRVGVEPATNLQTKLHRYASVNVPEYFSKPAYIKYMHNQRAQVITSIAMFYDLDDPLTFCRDLKECLSPNGLWINQMSAVGDMIQNGDYPNICHEHVAYYSLATFRQILSRVGLKLLDVIAADVNGGSMRTIVTHQESSQEPDLEAMERINRWMKSESDAKLAFVGTYRQFSSRVARLRSQLLKTLRRAKREGKSISVYGASTKGNTLLQYCGLSYPFISSAFERNPDKVGRYTVASNIPIMSDAAISVRRPDVLLVLPWHFRDEFIDREQAYLQAGGVMLFPLPEVNVVHSDSMEKST